MKLSRQIHELGELFEQVQVNSVLLMAKLSPMYSKRALETIQAEYQKVKSNHDFSLKICTVKFDLPSSEITYSEPSKGIKYTLKPVEFLSHVNQGSEGVLWLPS